MFLFTSLFAPWFALVREAGARPQLYADNLKVSRTNGPLCVRAAARASARFVSDIGQLVAPSKSFFSSTCPRTRRRMKNWTVQRSAWGVLLDFRDLGGHLDLTRRRVAATVAARADSVIAEAKRMAALPLSFDYKVRIAVAKYSARAMWGCEAASLSLRRVALLRGALLAAVWPRHLTLRSPCVVLGILSRDVLLDPSS